MVFRVRKLSTEPSATDSGLRLLLRTVGVLNRKGGSHDAEQGARALQLNGRDYVFINGVARVERVSGWLTWSSSLFSL